VAKTANPIVDVQTSQGKFAVELWADRAPNTVENFLKYVDEKFFDGTIFHRVIKGFMIQGGGFTEKMDQKRASAPIANEAKADVKNARGTLAMARTNDPHSATAQFFINTVDNDFLNFTAANPRGFGYAVFGKVVEGMDVVDKIEKVSTTRQGGHDDVPTAAVVIQGITRR
jgi:peptidyl-prolyl cis-trans isomerase B (cyclophilin B)